MRLLQLNTELSWHDEKIEAFLSKEEFDVLTLQEVSRRTLERFAHSFTWHFERNFFLQGEEFGVAILIRKWLKLLEPNFHQYLGGDGITENPYVSTDWSDYYDRGRFWILAWRVISDDQEVPLWTNYFPVAYPAHETNERQRFAMASLIPLIEGFSDIILTWDFNVARSNNENDLIHPLYSSLGRVLKDNIPPHINNTLDPELHRVRWLEVVCDYIWSRWNTRVSDVQIHNGLSDHQGISANIGIEK